MKKVIKEKAYLYYFLVAFISSLILLAVFFINDILLRSHQKNISNSLKAINTTTRKSILNLYRSHLNQVRYWSQNKDLIQVAKQLKEVPHKDLLTSPIQTKARALLIPIKKLLNYDGFFIITPNGLNLSSSRDNNIGTSSVLQTDPHNWELLVHGHSIITSPIESDVPLKDESGVLIDKAPTMFVGSPIYNNENSIIAFLAFRLKPKDFMWANLKESNFGKTGESYAINELGYLLSPTRFERESNNFTLERNFNYRDILKFNLKGNDSSTVKILDQIHNQKVVTNIDGYYNYNRVRVVGYWSWVPELNWIIVTEQEYKEAYGPYIPARNVLWLFCTLLISVVILFFSKVYDRVVGLQLKIHEKEKSLQSIFNNVNIILYRCNPRTWKTTYINLEVEKITGYPANDFTKVKGRTFESLIVEKDREIVRKKIMNALILKKYYEVEYQIHNSQGEICDLYERGRGSYDKDGICTSIDAFIIDITKQKSIEKELEFSKVQSLMMSKMAALGQMAGGVAHEINNPLAIITARTSQISRKVYSNQLNQEELVAYLNQMNLMSDRIHKIIKGMRKFSKDFKHVNIREHLISNFLNETIYVIQDRLLRSAVRLKLDIRPDNLYAYFDDAQLSQVILHLITNSLDALEEVTHPWIKIYTEVTNSSLKLMIQDNGPGISQDLKDKVFDPFFTTKEVGKGTGLGLSISLGICQKNNINLSLRECKKGALFCLEFMDFYTSPQLASHLLEEPLQ